MKLAVDNFHIRRSLYQNIRIGLFDPSNFNCEPIKSVILGQFFPNVKRATRSQINQAIILAAGTISKHKAERAIQ